MPVFSVVYVVVEGRKEDEAHVASGLHWAAGLRFLGSALVLRGQIAGFKKTLHQVCKFCQVRAANT